MSAGWQVGDLALKVGGVCTVVPRGAVHRVEGLCWHERSQQMGILLDWHRPKEPGVCRCFLASNFRKIRPDEREACEPEFVTLLNRIKRKVGEPA